ncbi:MAG: class I SAM-dependent methyltransferase [Microbacteriaceae bacterium]|nr:class I SAM-dependent methyltransferase [Microbacteriaceae bacterium]MCL2795086.1 class I SAM-dependent methyltransferase [Microbacteriaceae bacterium]
MTDDERLEAIRERFDGRAESYDDSAMHRALAAAVADFVDLEGVETVLDVATGTGLVLRALAARAGGEANLDSVASAQSVSSDSLPGSAESVSSGGSPDEVQDGPTGEAQSGSAGGREGGSPGDAKTVSLGGGAAGHPLRLLGIDLSPGMLAVARRELPSAEFVEARAEELPVADASADLVLCVTALHIFADPSLVFEEFARVLAPGGALVTATFLELAEHGHGHGQGPDSPVTPGYTPNHAPFASPEALADAAAPAGFVVTRFEERALEGDRVLIAELAAVD